MISGVSSSCPMATGGLTVIRYFSLNAPEAMMFFRNASIFFAMATLSCSILKPTRNLSLGDELLPAILPLLGSAFPRGPALHGFLHLLALFGAVDHHLLRPAEQGAQSPINREPGGHSPTETANHNRAHELKDLLLRGIHARLRRALLLHKHGDHDRNRQDVIWIGRGEIVDPKPTGMAKLNGVVQHGVESD